MVKHTFVLKCHKCGSPTKKAMEDTHEAVEQAYKEGWINLPVKGLEYKPFFCPSCVEKEYDKGK